MWHVIQYGLFQTLWERKIMHALSLGAMLCHVEIFYCSMLLMGTAANPILRYQHQRRVTNMQFIHKTCELACAENEIFTSPPASNRGSCSALPYLGAAEQARHSGALCLYSQSRRSKLFHWEAQTQPWAPILAMLHFLPCLAVWQSWACSPETPFWWTKLLLSNQAAVSGGVL